MAKLPGTPGDRHHAHGSVEVRQLEVNLGHTVGINLDDPGVQRDRVFDRRVAFHSHATATIAAGAQRASLSAHPVDQPPIKVANLKPHAALGVEPALRIGHLEACHIEDAEVDGRNGDACVLASLKTRHRHRDG